MGQKNSRSTTPSPQAPRSLSRGYSQTNSQGQYPGTTQPNPSRGSATQNRQQMFVVTVPHGVRPGQRFAVLVNGQRHEVVCPQTAREGSQIHLSFPSTGGGPTQQPSHQPAPPPPRNSIQRRPSQVNPNQQRYRVVVPRGVQPGHNFAVIVNGQRTIVRCPENVTAGQTIEIVLQQQAQHSSSRNLQLNNHTVNRTQRYRVKVPPGVRPGQPFRVNVGGRLFQVVCPPNTSPGSLLELELPALTQESFIEDNKISSLDKFAAERKKKAGDDSNAFSREVKDGKVVWVAQATAVEDGGPKTADGVPVAAAAPVKGLVRQMSEGGTVTLVNAEDAVTDMSFRSGRGQFQLSPQQLVDSQRLPLSKKIAFFWSVLSEKMAIPWEQGHVKLQVRRDRILDDSLNEFQKLQSNQFHQTFRFKFKGEEGLDAGGLAREWFTLVAQELFNPDFGLFQPGGVGGEVVGINPNSGLANEHHIQYFRMAGQFLGKALFDHQNVPIHLIMPMYKHMLGMPVTLHDLEAIDDSLKKGLNQMKKLEDVSVVGEGFVVTEKIFGMNKQVELIEGGNDIDVTNENFDQYVECMVKYYLLDRINAQLSALLQGFYEVIPPVLLSIFDFQELELVLCGLPNIDVADWEKNTDYTGEYKRKGRSHKIIKWFWKLVQGDEEFSDEERARLLQFSTGTCRVPALGFGALQGRDGDIRHFTIDSCKLSESIFPRAHTCFNRIELPPYKSYGEMKRRIKEAIQMELTGFGME